MYSGTIVAPYQVAKNFSVHLNKDEKSLSWLTIDYLGLQRREQTICHGGVIVIADESDGRLHVLGKRNVSS